jgi:hypothetical protein
MLPTSPRVAPLALLGLAVACGHPPSPTSATSPATSAPRALPLERAADGRVVVPVELGGAAPAYFLLDAAAASSAVSAELRDALHLATVGDARVQLPAFAIGGARCAGYEVDPLTAALPAAPHPLAGVLGRDFLADHRLTLDLGRHELRIEPAAPAWRVPAGYDELRVSDLAGGLAVELVVGGRHLTALFDLAAPRTMLSSAAARASGVAPAAYEPPHGDDAPAVEVTGEVRLGTLVRANLPLQIADPARLRALPAPGPWAIVGMDLVDGRVVIVDYHRHLLAISR